MSIHRIVIASSLLLSTNPAAPSGNAYELTRVTINSGGGDVAQGELVLRSTLGQNLAGTSRGEGYALQLGFWTAADLGSVFKDDFEETP